MYERMLLESGKVVGGRRVSGIGADVVDESRGVAIPVFIPEGKAEIVRCVFPSRFTPGVAFGIATEIKNVGTYIDDLFVRVTNVDTGDLLGYMVLRLPVGGIDTFIADVTLVQEYDFNGLVEVGHVE